VSKVSLDYYECDDGSLAIEFVSNDFRIGICFEKDLEQSGWYYVDKDPTLENSPIEKEMVDKLKKHLEKYE